MSSMFGSNIRLSIFGESHGAGIGVVIDGLPAGIKLDRTLILSQMARRAPGRDSFSTKRTESDMPELISGVLDGVTTGAPLCALIKNNNTRSQDYQKELIYPRPSHADLTGFLRYEGYNDIRGGGHFSGRLTAPIVFAGSICRQILEMRGVTIGAHIYLVGDVYDHSFSLTDLQPELLRELSDERFAVIDKHAQARMLAEIESARIDEDSVGGVVECGIVGYPAGLGSPMMDTLESTISSIMFAIPAVKGIEFGLGFDISTMRGSAANDQYFIDGGEIKTRSNNNGGILGGISTGMPIVFRTAIKPTPSIGKEQNTVDIQRLENAKLKIRGRHDPCIVPRAVPVIEAAAAIALVQHLR